jgi:hypothetical protein
MLKYVWLPEYRSEAPPPQYSLLWFEKFIIGDDEPFRRVPLGAYASRK